MEAEQQLGLPGVKGFLLIFYRAPRILDSWAKALILEPFYHPDHSGGKRWEESSDSLRIARLSGSFLQAGLLVSAVYGIEALAQGTYVAPFRPISTNFMTPNV